MSKNQITPLTLKFHDFVEELRGEISNLATKTKDVDDMGDLASLEEALRKANAAVVCASADILTARRLRVKSKVTRGF